jgi:hypothetical protein
MGCYLLGFSDPPANQGTAFGQAAFKKEPIRVAFYYYSYSKAL